jgi:membrane-associated phospholipid phosphatase
MKHHQPIRYFFSRYVTFFDRVFISLTVFSLIIASILFLLNKTDFHYNTVVLFATDISSLTWLQSFSTILLSLIFLFYGMYIRNESPWASTFIWGLGLFFWCMLANMLLVNSIQATPFSPIDPWLLKADRWMGINTSVLMEWTHNHPDFHKLFNFTYLALLFELIGIPMILTFFNGRKSLSVFYIAQLSTMIVGSLIYFFFPTMAPSGIVHSPYFSHAQDDTSLRFLQIHHFLKPTSTDGGLIAFPSFHVIWAILLVNACRAKKIFFYPILCFNIILIIATVFLGWHYVTDVISGVILALLGIAFGNWVYKKQPHPI